MSARETGDGGPWYARLLTEKGLGTLLAVVLVAVMIIFGARLLADMQAYQSQALVEAARTNEKLEQLAISHAQMQIQMDRIEALLIARAQP